jgi:hypothetical protein
MGKDSFLDQVARGTIKELLRLDLRGDALRILWLFSRQLGRAQASRLVMDFGFQFLSTWIAPPRVTS